MVSQKVDSYIDNNVDRDLIFCRIQKSRHFQECGKKRVKKQVP